jgi:hypothetical protein
LKTKLHENIPLQSKALVGNYKIGKKKHRETDEIIIFIISSSKKLI